jgi:hypothetical protein
MLKCVRSQTMQNIFCPQVTNLTYFLYLFFSLLFYLNFSVYEKTLREAGLDPQEVDRSVKLMNAQDAAQYSASEAERLNLEILPDESSQAAQTEDPQAAAEEVDQAVPAEETNEFKDSQGMENESDGEVDDDFLEMANPSQKRLSPLTRDQEDALLREVYGDANSFLDAKSNASRSFEMAKNAIIAEAF